MYTLKKLNVVKKVDTEQKKDMLIKKGFKLIEEDVKTEKDKKEDKR